MKRRSRWSWFLACTLVLAALPASAQERDRPLPPGIEDLPIGFSPEELRRLHEIGLTKALTAPPIGPVRAAAEWDESDGVFCLWDNASLMRELALSNDVYIITTNQSWWLSWLASNAIPTASFKFLNAPTNSFWVRDYGPWFMWDGNQAFGLVDNIYNRPRPLDDVVPGAISSAYGVPYFGMDLIHTGGNYYADGYGNAWSSGLVLQENPTKTKAQVDQIMADYLGVARYLNPELNYDIEHFDTFGKLLAADTLLWGAFPQGTTPWAWSEGALKQIRKLQSPYGWPYKIHRMPLWTAGSSWTAYINSLMTQDKIVMSAYNTANDNTAQAIYTAAAPGYSVAKVSAQSTYWGDSVHCRTRNFVRGDALRIYPRPHWERSDDDVNPYAVSAEVIPDPSTALAGPPLIWWSVTGGPPFTAATMTATGNPFEYAGSIPAWSHGTTVSYYIEAADQRGVVKRAPFVAPAGLFTIEVAQDDRPPEVEHVTVHSLDLAAWPPQLVATATDDTGIPTLTLESSINNVPQPPIAMVKDAGTFDFRASLAGSVALGSKVRYRIVASDQAAPANVTTLPTAGWHVFVIENVPSVLVVELDQTPDSGDALVAWCDDLGLPVESATSWPTSLAGYDAVLVSLGMQPADVSLSSAQANALTAYLNGGGRVWLEGGDAWAQASTSSVYRAWFGVASASSGTTLSAALLGVGGAVTEGMSFSYDAENASSDHLTPVAGAQTLLTSGGQGKAVAYSTGTYRTVATSFHVSGLVDGAAPSRAKLFAGEALDWLDLGIDLIATQDPADPTRVTIDLEADPGQMYALFRSPAPGYQSFGAAGVLRLERSLMTLVHAKPMPASGRTRFELTLPGGAALYGTEMYFQAYARDSSLQKFHLTNRDRVRIGLP